MAKPELEYDLIVVGSGAAGLSAAITAAYHGLSVVVLEKADGLGGATAWSGGWMWIPLNSLAKRAGINEDPDTVRTYLRHRLGKRYDSAKIDAFLDAAPRMVDFFDEHTALQFADGNAIPDIYAETPGAGTGGRSVIAAPFDGRDLGKTIHKLRKIMRETAFLGMPIQAGPDLTAFLTCTRSLRSALHVAKRFTRHMWDLARYGRAMQLVNGAALIARLVKSGEALNVTYKVSSPVTQLVAESGRIQGVVANTTPEGEIELRSRRGVVLAAGGFPYDVERRRELIPRTPTGEEHWPLPPTSSNGDGLRLGETAGGVIETDLESPVAWAPISLVPYGNGRVGHFPHIIDRGKPGIIGVLADGCRFVNEAYGYYDYVAAMVREVPDGQEVTSWLICTHRFQRRYGIGITRPSPAPFRHWIRKGYLKQGRTVEELAGQCGIDPQGLARTIREYNKHARHGEDPDFGRGSTPYNRKQGDPANKPNPCIAPLDKGPYYAVKIVPGCFGTFAGLKTNAEAQVLDVNGEAITGLYAAGTDMASIMGGHYPAGGINLGPAMAFGHIAGLHAAKKLN